MRIEKKGIIDKLEMDIKGTDTLLFTDYTGIKAIDLTHLRLEVNKAKAKYKVIKNRLFKRALIKAGLKDAPVQIKGPLAIAYGGNDAVQVVKILAGFVKDHPNTINIKAGFVEGAFLKGDEIVALANLPSKGALLGQLVSQIASPLSRLIMVIQGPIQKLAYALSEIGKKK